ncbi:MAG: hypothetical protein AAFU85_26895 [Planctomycetota bacterium]
MSSKQTRKFRYDFRGHQAIPLAASGAGTPFVKADTSDSGSPTVGGLDGGGLRLQLASANEIENLCVFFGDVLAFDIDEIICVEFIVKAPQTLNAASSIAFGLCSARNDTIDDLAAHASFRCIGNNNVVVETDDGVNDNNGLSSGLSLATSWERYAINFASRNTTIEPPSVSLGRKSNIEFYGTNGYGSKRRVASGTRFDMTNYSGGLQPYIQLQKTADANTDAIDLLEICIEVNQAV